MKLRILERKYKRESIFCIQQLHGDHWEDLLNYGPYHTLDTAKEAAGIISEPPPPDNYKEVIHDYP